MPETLDGACTFVIGEMAATLDNTHLQLIWVWSLHQHIHVVIRLNHHCLGLSCKFDSLVCHTTDISHDHKLITFKLDGITDSLCGIVGTTKYLTLKSPI